MHTCKQTYKKERLCAVFSFHFNISWWLSFYKIDMGHNVLALSSLYIHSLEVLLKFGEFGWRMWDPLCRSRAAVLTCCSHGSSCWSEIWEAEKTKLFSPILDLLQTRAETVNTRKLSDMCNPSTKEGILLAIYAYIANNVPTFLRRGYYIMSELQCLDAVNLLVPFSFLSVWYSPR